MMQPGGGPSTYPVSSIVDEVMNTLILFPLEAASCSSRRTTREREWVRIVWSRKDRKEEEEEEEEEGEEKREEED